jgi:hypothetical protein
LESRSGARQDQDFHPRVRRLLDEFGDRDDVRRQLNANVHTFGWTGSTADYYRLYEQPLAKAAQHPIAAVRRWARQSWGELLHQISMAKDDDEERFVIG